MGIIAVIIVVFALGLGVGTTQEKLNEKHIQTDNAIVAIEEAWIIPWVQEQEKK